MPIDETHGDDAFKLQYTAGGVKGAVRVLILAIFMKVFKNNYTRVGRGKKQCPCCGWKGTHFFRTLTMGMSVSTLNAPAYLQISGETAGGAGCACGLEEEFTTINFS